MASSTQWTVCFATLLFLAGLYFYAYYGDGRLAEGFAGAAGADSKSIVDSSRCPNLLIQKGTQYYLYNSKQAPVPGVNPIVFNDLEEYTEFLDWQHSVGIRCPVLYVQSTYDAQGNRVYKARPSATELEGGLPPSSPLSPSQPPLPLKFTKLVDASRADAPYNENSYPSFDQSSYYVGALTPLDMIKNSQANMLYSDNAMDPNWGGQEYTQALVDAGYYKGNEVDIKVA